MAYFFIFPPLPSAGGAVRLGRMRMSLLRRGRIIAPYEILSKKLRRGRCLHRPVWAYTEPLVNGVIAKPARTPAVAIRSPLDLHRGAVNGGLRAPRPTGGARGAVDDRRWSALSPPPRWQNFLPRFICIPAYIFRQSHQHRPGTSRKNLCVYLIFPEVTIFSSCRENFFVLCSV